MWWAGPGAVPTNQRLGHAYCRLLLRPESPNPLARGTSCGNDRTARAAYGGCCGDDRTARAAYGGGATRFLARGREPND